MEIISPLLNSTTSMVSAPAGSPQTWYPMCRAARWAYWVWGAVMVMQSAVVGAAAVRSLGNPAGGPSLAGAPQQPARVLPGRHTVLEGDRPLLDRVRVPRGLLQQPPP